MHLTQRKMLAFVLLVIRHPRWVLALGVSLTILGALLAVFFLPISTDQNKLFSARVPFFHRYLQFIHEFPENEAAYIVITPRNNKTPPPAQQWVAAADAVTRRLRGLSQYVRAVDSHVPLHQLGPWAICFAGPRQVAEARAAQPDIARLATLFTGRSAAKNALLGKNRLLTLLKHFPLTGLNGRAFLRRLSRSLRLFLVRPPDDPHPAASMEQIFMPARRATPRDLGYYYFHAADNVNRRLLVINVYPRFTYDSLAAVSLPLEKISAAVHAAAAPFASEFHFGLTGRPVLSADEMRITTHDTNWAEALAMTVVVIGLILMLRSVWLAVAAGVSLTAAIAWTFGYATIVVGRLNLLSTVFVIAMIGIGMDYIIQILVRYRREVRRYQRPSAVWMRVFRYSGPAVLTACCGASAAFLVALTTHFTGDAELGVIAGGGLIFSLLSGFTILPAMLTIWPPKFKPVPAARRYTLHKAPPKATWWNFVALGCWLALVVLLSPIALSVKFNPNLLKLQARGLKSVQLIKDMPSWYAVVLSHHPEKIAVLQHRLNATIHAGSQILSTSSLYDAINNQKRLARGSRAFSAINWTPPPALSAADIEPIRAAVVKLADSESAAGADGHKTRQSLIQLAAALRQTPTDISTQRLTAWQDQWVQSLKALAGRLSPPPIIPHQLPPSLRAHFIGKSGVWALYIYPRWNLWIDKNLHHFVRTLRGTKNAPGGRIGGLVPADMDLTGIAPQLYDSTQSIKQAFTKCTILALILVIIIVFLDLRKFGQTLLTVSVLLLGLPMLACVMGLLHLDWNFANFFAMPILIGAGHEYGVFMTHRYRETLHNPRRVWRFWDVSERALLMCAFVTCSAFGFLALGRDRGIASLGLVMTLGIACIYLAAILVIRPILLWRLAHKDVYADIYDRDDDDV